MINYNLFNFRGFQEIISTPLQASTFLFSADQRRVAQTPPLPPITKEQIAQGELNDLLEELDYNLSTIVTKYLTPCT